MRRRIDFSEYTVSPAGWPQILDGVTVCHLSDVHSNRMADLSAPIIAELRRRKPDLLLVSGDMTDCSKDRCGRYFFSIVDRIGSIPVLCAPGNHERRIGEGGIPREFAAECAARGIPYLDNASCTVSVRNTPLTVYGYLQPFVSFNAAHEKRSRLRQDITADELTATLGKCVAPSVLLAHDPMLFPTYAEWGASLVLAGHLHGGQVRLPLVGGLLSPARTFFPKYDAGKFTRAQTTMLVSRGICFNELPRVFNPPEVAFITLRAEKEENA